jgi:mono/diheme cytochrome c family protein
MPPRALILILLTAANLAAGGQPPPAASRPVAFVRDIQPIFAKHCLECHGAQKQKGGLRLDQKKAALAGGDSGPAIVPGRSAQGRLLPLVSGLDSDMVMPPKGPRLSPEQIDLLRAWIEQGAIWPDQVGADASNPLDWWAFKPLARPLVPLARGGAAGSGNPVDAFIAEQLRRKALTPAPPADRRTLIRRLCFDLVGLPPTPEEVEAFVADTEPRAYEKLVDRLLESPRHGERWARHWLDVAHYGETHGYDKDKLRPNAWPYRDYVIRALNEDKPWARFVQEQIAGDILFPHTRDGVEALGFLAAGPWDFIGHAELPETKIDGKIARHLDRDDMVQNTFLSFASLTVGCAQCHDHKFDPVTQEDYYSLQTVFAALDRADKLYDTDPALGRRRTDLLTRQRELKSERDALDQTLVAAGGRELDLIEKLLREAKQGVAAQERAEFGWHSQISKVQEAVKWVQIDLGRTVELDQILYAGCHDNFNNIGPGFGFPVRFKVEASDDATFRQGVILMEDQTAADLPNPGITPRLIAAGGRNARYLRFTATKLAPRQNDFIFALAELQLFDKTGRNLALGAVVTSLDSIEAPPRWGQKNLTDGYYYGVKKEAAGAKLADLERQRAAVLARIQDAPLRARLDANSRATATVNADLAKLPAPNIVYAGTVHHGTGSFRGTGPDGGRPRPIPILRRGDVKQPGTLAVPGAPSLVPGLSSRFPIASDAPEGARRVALAQWLSSPANPLIWRSIVNRVWQHHFGRGLVGTPNDFGRMGSLPTHPELLDWLALEFRDGGGSLKKMHRLIVTSATYRQSSSATAAGIAADPDNRHLARQNRRKLEAEAVRDAVLAVSGRLDLTMGGAGFQDFVITHPEHSPHYEYQLHDPDDPRAHRRAIYRFVVRSQMQPFMTALDCADPSMQVDRRNQSLSAPQALALLNNGLMLTMARHLATRLEKEVPEASARIRRGFALALGRLPTESEQRTLEHYAREHGLPNACRLLFNLNEFVFVD